MFSFEPSVTGRAEKLLKSDVVAVSVKVTKNDKSLEVEVTSKDQTLSLGSFPRQAAVESFIDQEYLFVLACEYTAEGKITSTRGIRIALSKGGLKPVGTFEGAQRVDWRTAKPRMPE